MRPREAVKAKYVVKLWRFRLLVVNGQVLADEQRAVFGGIGNIAFRIDNERPIELIVINVAMQQAIRASSSAPIKICAGRAGLEHQVATFTRSNHHGIFRRPRSSVQSIKSQRLIEKIVDRGVDRGSFRHTDKWPRSRELAAEFPKCGGLKSRTIIFFRIPVAHCGFQLNSQNSILEPATWNLVRICGNRRKLSCNRRDNRQIAEE